MIRKLVLTNTLELLLALQFILLFNFPNLTPLALILSIIWVIVAFTKKSIAIKINAVSIGFVALYLAYAIGIIWTNNMPVAKFYLENKLSFLIYPLFFSFALQTRKFNLSIVLKGLIIAIGLSMIINFTRAIPCYLEQYYIPACFLKSHLSPTIHPTYLSVGTQMAIACIFWLMKEQKIRKSLAYLLIVLFTAYIFLLMSLSGILFFLLSTSIFIFFRITKNRSKTFIISFALSILAFLILLFNTPYLKKDIDEVKQHVSAFFDSKKDYIANFPKEGASSSQVRIMLWIAATEEIKKHPMGVGTANVDQLMGENLRSKQLNELASHNYNPHNQFLHTWLEIGLIGLLIILFIIIYGLYWGWKNRNWLLIVLLLNLAFNCLFESMLQTQSGIMFYPLFFMIVSIHLYSTKKLAND